MKELNFKQFKDNFKKYQEDGFCVIRNILNPSDIEDLMQILSKIIEQYKDDANVGSYINYADREKGIVNSIHRLQEFNNPELDRFIKKNSFKEIADFFLNSDSYLFSIQAFLKPPGIGLKTPIHQDNAYWCHDGNGGITLWISLDKAGKFNSMMKFAKRSPNHLITHIQSNNTPGSSQIIPDSIISEYEWEQPELNKGDVSIHHGYVLHFSEVNNSDKPRRGFLLNFRSKNCKRDEKMYSDYLERLEKIYGR